MKKARRDFYLIPLADGHVLALGGMDETFQPRTPVLEAEWYDPDATVLPEGPEWKLLAAMGPANEANTYRREYHAAAVMVDDARVFVTGGQYADPQDGHTIYQRTGQIFRPPYLFNAAGQYIEETTDRPIISDLTQEVINYNKDFAIHLDPNRACGNEIQKVTLVRLGAATHSYDQNTRFVPLSFTVDSSTVLRATAPYDGKIAPPGYYMLFVCRQSDVAGDLLWPSKAWMVQLRPALNQAGDP